MSEKILQEVVDFCRKSLDLSDEAQSYLAERNISRASVDAFEIGFCPTNMKSLFKHVDPAQLRELGFIKDASFNWFANRVVFPVRDQYNKLVAVAGRILPRLFTGKRKYFNTFYFKGKVLYGMNLAIPHIRKQSEVIVSEGQIDIITAFQHNIRNIVSTCGTAFTFDHAMLLSRYATTIKVLYDADKAGQNATERILEKDFKGVKVEPILLTPGDDVDSYLNKYGVQSLMARFQGTNFKNEVYDRFN